MERIQVMVPSIQVLVLDLIEVLCFRGGYVGKNPDKDASPPSIYPDNIRVKPLVPPHVCRHGAVESWNLGIYCEGIFY